MAVDGTAGPSMARRAIKLSTAARWGLGFVGATSWFAGGLAVFESDVEAGPVALIITGGLFLMMGLAGYLPTRLRIGDQEAEWLEAVEEAFEMVIDAVPAADHTQVTDAVDQLAHASPVLAERIRRRHAVRHILMSRLSRAAARARATVLNEPAVSVPVGARPDAVVVGPNDSKVWVILEDRYPKGWELASARNLLSVVTDHDRTFKGILILCPATPSERGGDDVMHTDKGDVWVVVICKGDEPPSLDAALASAFDAR